MSTSAIYARDGWWRWDHPAEVPALAAPLSRTRSATESPLAFGALLAFTFVLILAPQNQFPLLKLLRIAFLTAVLSIAAQILHRLLHGQPLMRITREMVVAGALAGWAVASVPLSYWPGGSLDLLFDLYFKALALFWLLANVVTTPERLRRMCLALSLMTIPLSLAGVSNYLAGEHAGASYRRIVGYDAGLTHNPNDLALMLNLLLPLSVASLAVARRRVGKLVLVGTVALNAAAIILTFSRAGFLTLCTTTALFLASLARRGRWRWVLVLLILSLASLPLLPGGYTDRLATIIDIDSDPTGSAQTRWGDTVAAAFFVADHPLLGAGAGMNALALNAVRGRTWTMVHNAYLEYAVDLGLPGLALFVLLLFGCFHTLRTVRRRSAASPDLRELGHLAHGIQASLAAFAVAAFFHPVAYQFYFFHVAGLTLAARAAWEAHVGRRLFED